MPGCFRKECQKPRKPSRQTVNRPKLEPGVSRTQITATPFWVHVWVYKHSKRRTQHLTTHIYNLQLTIKITATKYFDRYQLQRSESRRGADTMGEECVSDARMWGKGPVADSNLVGRYSSVVTCDPSKGQNNGRWGKG